MGERPRCPPPPPPILACFIPAGSAEPVEDYQETADGGFIPAGSAEPVEDC
jgi:hypothetical protein